ncbi:MAG: hypothetical protein M1481_06005 [Candidatus Thermoplasmatota archaeon]|jgi:hypothetical protein|nr:hypothetical protein [Candidatus Thermoplasmatota archaeon]
MQPGTWHNIFGWFFIIAGFVFLVVSIVYGIELVIVGTVLVILGACLIYLSAKIRKYSYSEVKLVSGLGLPSTLTPQFYIANPHPSTLPPKRCAYCGLIISEPNTGKCKNCGAPILR